MSCSHLPAFCKREKFSHQPWGGAPGAGPAGQPGWCPGSSTCRPTSTRATSKVLATCNTSLVLFVHQSSHSNPFALAMHLGEPGPCRSHFTSSAGEVPHQPWGGAPGAGPAGQPSGAPAHPPAGPQHTRPEQSSCDLQHRPRPLCPAAQLRGHSARGHSNRGCFGGVDSRGTRCPGPLCATLQICTRTCGQHRC